MKIWKMSLCGVMMMALAACGGVPDDDTSLNELDDDERTALCEEVKLEATECTETDEDGTEITISAEAFTDVDQCASFLAELDCDRLTVGDFRALRDDTCSDDGKEAIGVALGCALAQ